MRCEGMAGSIPRIFRSGKLKQVVDNGNHVPLFSYASIASLVASRPADRTESVIRGDHYGQSNDRQNILWRESREQTRCKKSRCEENDSEENCCEKARCKEDR